MKYIVTGACGFIGSRLALELSAQGHELVVVDRLNEAKVDNLSQFAGSVIRYLTPEDFLKHTKEHLYGIDGVFHQGACSDTTHVDPAYVMRNNYEFTRNLIFATTTTKTRLVYASSAAVYGNGRGPLNVYGMSKLLIDVHVSKFNNDIKEDIVGLRYFNVYGSGEEHKGDMASLAYQLHVGKACDSQGSPILFDQYGGYEAGEHRRDFVYIDDVVATNLKAMEDRSVHGIFDVGTGRPRTFNEVAKLVTGKTPVYRPFPSNLKDRYQIFTCARDLPPPKLGLRFRSLEEGVKASVGLWRV